jgi:integrase
MSVPADLNRFYGDLLGGGLAPRTVELVARMMSGAFRRAVDAGILESNPCQRARPPKAQTRETPVWELHETQEFFANPVVRAHPHYTLFKLMGATGLRRGEALALSRGDCDLEDGVIHVRRNLAMVGSDVQFGSPKTRRSRRDVTIGADVVDLLRSHLAQQRELQVAMGSEWNSTHDLVFPDSRGEPQNPTNVTHAFRALVAKTGLPRVPLHALRHAHGSLCLERGMPVVAVAARLGHSPAVLLSTYARARDGSQDIAAGLEGLLDGEQPPALTVVPGADEDDEDEDDAVSEGAEQ